MAITKRQRQVFEFIDDFIKTHKYSPSFEEIAKGMRLSSLATIHKHLMNLEKKGLIRRGFNRSRSIDVVPARARTRTPQPESGALPLVGRIAAGRPLEAIETPESISLADITRSKDVYCLQVAGASMQDEHIVDGDYVLVEKTQTARNGEIVVALVGGSETTLKRIYKEGETVRLQPSNAAMAPIIVPADSVQVQGRVIGVLRKY